MGAVLAAMLTTMFSFMGTEIVTIAAAESKDPSKQITKATNSVIWRIGLFYLVSIFIVVALVPWNDQAWRSWFLPDRAGSHGHPECQADRRPRGIESP
jgi:GABA permease